MSLIMCACGCGYPAKRKWASDECRETWRNEQRRKLGMTPAEKRRRPPRAKQLLELAALRSVETMVVRVSYHEDVENKQEVVGRSVIPHPTMGLWGY